MDFLELWDYVVPCLLIFCGFRWIANPPEFGSQKGIVTRRAKQSEESWRIAHLFGGKICIAYGIITLALAIAKRFIDAGPLSGVLPLTIIVFNLVLIFSIVPAVNLYVKWKTR